MSPRLHQVVAEQIQELIVAGVWARRIAAFPQNGFYATG